MLGTPRSRRVGVMMLAIAALAVGGLAVWMSPGGAAGREQGTGRARAVSGEPGSIATTGRQATSGDSSGPAALATANIIHELETITGANDGHQLVGRRVDLHVPVQQHINDVAFWVGPGDNRLLVVLARDTRDGASRQRGAPSSSGLGTITAGQHAAIAGTIERVPYAEAMSSWGLTNADRAELMERRIYLRAESVNGR